MMVNIYFCLPVFVLNSYINAGVIRQAFREKGQITLRCPSSVKGEVTWSRENNGSQEKIVTIDGDSDINHLNKSNLMYNTQADKSLFISRITVSDSGRYFCNNETAVELTVIPSGTIIENVAEGSSISLKCPRDYGGSHVPERRKGLKAGRFDVSTEDKTLNIRNVKPKDSGLYYCDGKPDLYVNVSKRSDRGKKSTVATTTMTVPSTVQTKDTTPKPNTGKKSTVTTTTMIVPSTVQTKDTTLLTVTTVATSKPNTVNHLLLCLLVGIVAVLGIILTAIYFSRRRKIKRQETVRELPVYEEIPDVIGLTPRNVGEQKSAGQGSPYHLLGFPGGSNQTEPTYATIGDLPQAGNKTESPYSLLGSGN